CARRGRIKVVTDWYFDIW
nr:immunoglobulin heavy chain junction region [Macaca mulatta]MOY20531.1 immunoglobulin heavy chain junction region [Macaca mulatta]MOY20887.1 immunoglobulin heavy chain junction region [Macaca mulatta]MOY20956.1 immunoglobulin heavy chain junction region [Macaca mulatta]